MNKIYQFLIHRLIKWVGDLSPDNFKSAVGFVASAEEQYATSPDKRKYAMGLLKTAFPAVAGWVLNLLLELAVSYFKRTAK